MSQSRQTQTRTPTPDPVLEDDFSDIESQASDQASENPALEEAQAQLKAEKANQKKLMRDVSHEFTHLLDELAINDQIIIQLLNSINQLAANATATITKQQEEIFALRREIRAASTKDFIAKQRAVATGDAKDHIEVRIPKKDAQVDADEPDLEALDIRAASHISLSESDSDSDDEVLEDAIRKQTALAEKMFVSQNTSRMFASSQFKRELEQKAPALRAKL